MGRKQQIAVKIPYDSLFGRPLAPKLPIKRQVEIIMMAMDMYVENWCYLGCCLPSTMESELFWIWIPQELSRTFKSSLTKIFFNAPYQRFQPKISRSCTFVFTNISNNSRKEQFRTAVLSMCEIPICRRAKFPSH